MLGPKSDSLGSSLCGNVIDRGGQKWLYVIQTHNAIINK